MRLLTYHHSDQSTAWVYDSRRVYKEVLVCFEVFVVVQLCRELRGCVEQRKADFAIVHPAVELGLRLDARVKHRLALVIVSGDETIEWPERPKSWLRG